MGLYIMLSKMMFFKIQNQGMIVSVKHLFEQSKMRSIKAQTRLQRLRTILP